MGIKRIIEETSPNESTQRTVFEGEDGKIYEKLIQQIDTTSGLLECVAKKKGKNNIKAEEKESIRALSPATSGIIELPKTTEQEIMDETRRKQIIEEKFAKKAQEKARREANIKVAQMDEEDLLKEKQKSEQEKALDRIVQERNDEAIKNVEALRQMKAKLHLEGKTPQEIKKSVKELKRKQREPRRPGRPKSEAILAPRKDPETGTFYPSGK